MARRLMPRVRLIGAAASIIAGSAAADERALPADGTAAIGTARARAVDVAHSQALKLRYLACEQAAGDRALDSASIMACSVVYEDLKQRVFGGSFDALHAWWREVRDRGVR